MGDLRRTLLTISGTIPANLDAEVDAGERPRPDYRVLADRLDADVVDLNGALRATGRIGAVANRIGGPGLVLAWYVFRNRRRYDVILTDGEQVGLPLALLTRVFGSRGSKHVMIVHVLSVPKKANLIRWSRLAGRIDRYLVYSSRQAEFLRDVLRVPSERVVLTTFMVDTQFFSPDRVTTRRRPMICSAGLERRDYPTLMQAVDGLDVEVVVAAASPWSKRADSSSGTAIPSNVRIERLSLFELRELYAASQFVVMPLVEVDFQAGITTILEAMAMSRAVVSTRTAGQTDTIIDGTTGIYVAPGDPDALRTTIERLLDQPEHSDRIGAAARAWVVEHADVERYTERLAAVVASI